MRTAIFTLLAALILVNVARGQDQPDQPAKKEQRKTVFSGPQVGERITPFKVIRVDGPDTAVTEIGQAKSDQVTLLMFMHKLSEPAIKINGSAPKPGSASQKNRLGGRG